MQNKIAKNKYLMYVLIVVLAILLVLNFLFYSHIDKKKQQVIEYKKVISENKAVLDSSFDVKGKIMEVDDVTQKINSLYIPSDKAVIFIEETEKIAKKNGVSIEISSVDLKKVVADEKTKVEVEHGKLNMMVSAKGGWSEVMGFLKAIELMPYGVKIENSKINYSETEKGGYWSLVFSLSAITN